MDVHVCSCWQLLKVKADFRWGDGSTGLTHAPPDTPRCGFEGEKCGEAEYLG